MTEVMNSSQFEGSKVNSVEDASEKVAQPADNKSTDQRQEEIEKALKKRLEPLNELIYSEEGYVARLQIVKDSYIPAYGTSNELTSVYTGPPDPNEPPPDTTGPPVPEDLALRWRIVWGNWLQLYEWHSGFLEKLKRLITRDPEYIPKLFIDSRAKLSSIYSKYCENHRKAALIAEQFRDYFEELRIHVGDKQDVVSHLMQPVQRIMRYQLPMEVIVKYTRVADLPSLPTWQKALEIMKEIPKDTQLILEATMINNLPRVLTTLGKIHIRNNLMVACLSKSQFVDLINDVSKSIKSGRKLQTMAPLPASAPSPILMADLSSAVQTNWADDPLASFYGAASPLNGNASYAQCRFAPSRVFLFEKMLLITEEEAVKKRKNQQTSGEAFSQQTYTCSNSITVNNMKFEANWWMCARSLPDCKKALGVLEQWQKEERRFALWEQSANSDRYFIMDPVWADARASWVSELKDIHHMQEKLLQALQAPTKAAGFNASEPFPVDPALASWMDSSTPKPDSGPAVERHLSAPSHQPNRVHDTAPNSASASCSSPLRKEHARKWPSFSFRRPKLLLGSEPKDGSNCGTPSTVDSETASQKELRSGSNSASLTRAHSVERRVTTFKLKLSSSPGSQPRKCSLNMQQASLEHEASSASVEQQRSKKRSLMASLLGRFKSTSSGEVPNGSNDALQQQQ